MGAGLRGGWWSEGVWWYEVVGGGLKGGWWSDAVGGGLRRWVVV